MRNVKIFCAFKVRYLVTPDNFRNGEIVVNRRKVGNDVQYHEDQLKKMNDLCAYHYGQSVGHPQRANKFCLV